MTGINQASQESNPLSQMRPLHLPEGIDSWPWAPGWYVLLGIVLLSLLAGLYLIIKNHRSNLYRKQALQELKLISEGHRQNNETSHKTIQSLSSLYKRIALTFYPRKEVSKLNGKDWLVLLDQISDSQFFTQEEGQLLGEALFQDPEKTNIKASEIEVLLQESESIIRKLKLKQKPKLKGKAQ